MWFRVSGVGSTVQVSGLNIPSFVFAVQISRFWVQGFRVQGSGFRVQGAWCRVQGAGFRVQGYPSTALTRKETEVPPEMARRALVYSTHLQEYIHMIYIYRCRYIHIYTNIDVHIHKYI